MQSVSHVERLWRVGKGQYPIGSFCNLGKGEQRPLTPLLIVDLHWPPCTNNSNVPFNCQRQTGATLLTINSLQTASLETDTSEFKNRNYFKKTQNGKEREEISSFNFRLYLSFSQKRLLHVQETFQYQLCFSFILGLSCLFSFSLKKKKSSQKNPQG